MESSHLTNEDVRALLVAVGAPASTGVADFETSFEALDLDSLARTEIASRIQDRFGINVEDDLTPETTPGDMLTMVNDRLSAPVQA